MGTITKIHVDDVLNGDRISIWGNPGTEKVIERVEITEKFVNLHVANERNTLAIHTETNPYVHLHRDTEEIVFAEEIQIGDVVSIRPGRNTGVRNTHYFKVADVSHVVIGGTKFYNVADERGNITTAFDGVFLRKS